MSTSAPWPTSMAPPESALELKIAHSMRVRFAAMTLTAPDGWRSKVVCRSTTRPPRIKSALSEEDAASPSPLPGVASMVQFVTVRQPASILNLPRSRKLERWM
eukprot:4700560-Prymnesium_polylepis.3